MKRIDEPNTEPIRVDEVKFKVRSALGAYKDVQILRIMTGNRICASFKHDIEEDETDQVTKQLVKEYKRITDVHVEKFQAKGKIDKAIQSTDNLSLIKTRFDYQLVETYMDLLKSEENCRKNLEFIVKQHPMWELFFSTVKGCGPAIAGMCIAYLDIHKARHLSNFWSYCGVGMRFDPDEEEWVPISNKTLVDVEYINKKGEVAVKKSLGYNPIIKAQLMGVFVPSVLKTGKGSKYNLAYYEYKHRYQNRNDLLEASAMRIHRMASRQCVKTFLRDLWCIWREYEGYQVSKPYEVEYLNNAPHKYNEFHYRKATV